MSILACTLTDDRLYKNYGRLMGQYNSNIDSQMISSEFKKARHIFFSLDWHHKRGTRRLSSVNNLFGEAQIA